MFLDEVQAKKQTAPATRPIATAALGPTNPLAGVIATSPATAPDIPPSTLGFPLCSHSMTAQERAAAAVAKCVATKADTPRPLAATALPALKPNQPTQSNAAPMKL